MPKAQSRTIWLEPVLGQHRTRLIERCQAAARSHQEDRFIYLAATRPLLERVVGRVVDGYQVVGSRGLPIFLFDGFIKKLLSFSDAARYDRILIDEGAKYFLIEQVIGALSRRGALRYVPDIALLPGCVQSMGELIGELKRAAKRPEAFRGFLQEFGGNYRDEDLAEIYESYQQILDERRLMDVDDAYLLVRDMLARRELPAWLQHVEVLLLDGFFDFTPIQDEVLRQLVEIIPEVTAHFTFDARNPAVFAPVQSTIQGFEPLGFISKSEPGRRLKRHPLLEPVARYLFHAEAAVTQTNQPPPITIFSAPHALAEVQEMARYIKRLIIEDGYRPAEIAVVVRHIERYGPMVRRVFAAEGIPCGLDERVPLSAIPAVKAALKLLEARVGWEQIASFEALIKNDYVEPFGAVPRDAVDNALAGVGLQISTRDWIERAQRLRRAKETSIERLEMRATDPEEVDWEIRRLRREITEIGAAVATVEAMRRHLASLPDAATVGDFIAAYQGVLRAFRIRQRLEDYLRRAVARAESLSDIARDLKGLQKMGEILNQAARISAHGTATPTAISVSEFKALIDHWLGRIMFRLEAGDPAGVAVLEARQCHGLDFRAVFMAGMVQGQFPQAPKSDWMYPPAERQHLADFGLYLEDLSLSEFQKKENHFFYQCVSQATDRLYLSYPRTIGGDEETIPSTYLDDLRDLFRVAEAPIETRHIRFGDGGVRRAFSRAEVVQGIITGLWQMGSEDALILELYRQAHAKGLLSPGLFLRLKMEAARQGSAFGPGDGVLLDAAIHRHLHERFHRERLYSVGQFNRYGLCPFQFFCRDVLQLDARKEASLDLQAVDRRRLTYEILYEFLARHAREKLSQDKLDQYRQELDEISQALFARYEDTILPLHPQLWNLEKADIQAALRGFLGGEIAYQNKVAAQGVRPHWLELGFGWKGVSGGHADSKDDPLMLRRGSDVIRLRGRIDRVDRASDGKLVAYNYKASASAGMQAMRAGMALQIPIYILALRRLFSEDPEAIVGGGYYELRDGSRNKGLYREDQIHYAGVNPRTEASVSPEEWELILKECEAHIWRYVAGMRQGDFRVQPKTTEQCPRCDYRTVCRYEKHRIQRKTSE